MKRGAQVIVLSDDDDDADPPKPARRSGPVGQATQVIVLSDGEEDSSTSGGAAGSSSSSDGWKRPTKTITCPICFCESEPHEACRLAACGHAFCTDCIGQFVRAKIGDGEVLPEQLGCPCVTPSRCGAPLDPLDVKRCLATAAEADRYGAFAVSRPLCPVLPHPPAAVGSPIRTSHSPLACLAERLALERCIEGADDLDCCPTAGCPFKFAWDPGNRKLDCPMCRKSFCLVCRCEPWHAGMRCEQYRAEHGDEEAADEVFASFASRANLKQCPKCKFWVEKTDGCDAMHCRCNLVFCYKCGGVLKARDGIKQCSCGEGVAQLLRAHEGAANHNRPDQAGARPAAAAGRGGMFRLPPGVAARLAQLQGQIFHGGAAGARGGGGGGRRRRGADAGADDDSDEDEW